MTTRNDADRRLAAANRFPAGIAHTDASREMVDEIRARIVAGGLPVETGRGAGRRLLGARRVVLGAVIGVVGLAGAAAATTLLTSATVGAPGFCHTMRTVTADVPYPAGAQAWRNWALLTSVGPKAGTTLHELCDTPAGAHVADDGYPGRSAVLIGVEQGQVAKSAFCAWISDWLNAGSSGATATEAHAATEIAGALRWPASRASDPHPVAGVGARATNLGWFITAQRAVEAHDVPEVASMFDPDPQNARYPGSECTAFEPAPHSDNGTVLTLWPWQHA